MESLPENFHKMATMATYIVWKYTAGGIRLEIIVAQESGAHRVTVLMW
jgi:hypothetical protein